jgi:alpha-glucosidase (family GH31 glycosyl hydrolase)
MNINVPFVISSHGCGVYFENTWDGRFDFCVSDPHSWSYTAGGGELSYVVMEGPTPKDVLELYTWLTGRQPLPPRWAFGYIQSKFGYRTEQEASVTVQTIRQKRLPCDGLVLDLFWFDAMGDLAWRASSWPSPFGMMEDFLAQGIRTVVITEPFVAQTSPTFAEGDALGHFARTAGGSVYLLDNWWSCGCNAALVDFTSAPAREWWWSKHPSFFGSSLGGLWTDLGEPERHPDGMVHAGGPARSVHNIYSLLWAKTIWEGFGAFRPGQRLFNLTRSAYAGSQRFGVFTWSGDVARTFGGLAVQPPMMLSSGLSGLAYHGSDIGGFCCGTTTPELYVRWLQHGIFSPITRAHGGGEAVGGHGTEPWAFGPQAEAIARSLLELRYRLLPYNYTLAWENHRTGMPLARPLFIADDYILQLADVTETYLWGDAFAVSPVLAAGRTQQSVRLPAGEWYNFWTDELVSGGRTITAEAPLELIPVFVRAGSVVPMAMPALNSEAQPRDTIALAVYPRHGASGSGSMYEDDGATTAYLGGAYSLSTYDIQVRDSGGMLSALLTLNEGGGSYAGRPGFRQYLAEIHSVGVAPSSVRKGDSLIAGVAEADLRARPDAWWYDEPAHVLKIHTRIEPGGSVVIRADGIGPTGVRPDGIPGEAFALAPNYPNPFNASTALRFRLDRSGPVKLVVYDLLGRDVATLVDGPMDAGPQEIRWEAGGAPSGMYIVRLSAGARSASRAILLVR